VRDAATTRPNRLAAALVALVAGGALGLPSEAVAQRIRPMTRLAQSTPVGGTAPRTAQYDASVVR